MPAVKLSPMAAHLSTKSRDTSKSTSRLSRGERGLSEVSRETRLEMPGIDSERTDDALRAVANQISSLMANGDKGKGEKRVNKEECKASV